MVPPTPAPSTRFRRAASAERTELARHRERLLAARESLRAELARVEASLQEVDEREILLERLAGPAGERDRQPDGVPMTDAAIGRRGANAQVLRGPAIRRAAVEILLADPARPEALHYKDWFRKVRDAGFEVAGKDPLAVFLTQISRSPVVRRSTQAGVYELDRSAAQQLRARLDRLQEQLRQLTAGPSNTADLAAIRSQRSQLTAEMAKTEKLLEEAIAVLDGNQGRLVAAG